MTPSVSKVHLVFKTHFDFGFTHFAQKVVEEYTQTYIPRVLESARLLRQEGSDERIVWTTGSWLVYEYLEKASPRARKRMEKAIEAGDIVWHALPFTTHSELMDRSLFQFGLSLSQSLDLRFGKKTIAAKMTDVPGHTLGILSVLADAGIEFLHIGVNEAATPPEVPPLFVWKDDSRSEVVVMYQHAYGEAMEVPGLTEALAFGFTNDNLGPPSIEQIRADFLGARNAFPNALVQASTLDAFAVGLRPIQGVLPVVDLEIGDTWIHGVGTDPGKVSRYRALCRLRNGWLADEKIPAQGHVLSDFSRHLLCIPEHTWGLDEKTHLDDYQNYSQEAFQEHRKEPQFLKMESSWQEQRSYLDQAIDALDGSDYSQEAHGHLKMLSPVYPDSTGFRQVTDSTTLFQTPHFSLRFNPCSGAIEYLLQKETGRIWATEEYRMGWIRYQTFSEADYDSYLDQYLVRRLDWGILDNSKPGIHQAGAKSRWWEPTLSGLHTREDQSGHSYLLEYTMPNECTIDYGAPRRFTQEIYLPNLKPTLEITLQWFDKQACRLPEALWFSMLPANTDSQGWSLEKMGKFISPLQVVRNGNRKLHAVDQGIYYADAKGKLDIKTLDAPLVAPGTPSLLNFNNCQPDTDLGMHFNLYNNVWGTNFPMWYEEDARFRFACTF